MASERIRSFAAGRSLALTLMVAPAPVASLVAWCVTPGGPAVRGFVAGGALVAWIGYVAHWVSIASGATSWDLGAVGEQWTATELRRLRRRGWRIVNHVVFRTWDVDHIAVGREGVILVETKYRSGAVDLTALDGWLTSAAERLHRDERDVARFIGWGALPDAPIHSMLVVWGPQVDSADVEPITGPHGVEVVAGRNLRRTVAALGEPRLRSEEVDAIHRKLVIQATGRDRTEVTPASINEVAERCLLTFAVGLVGVLIALLTTRWGLGYFAAAAGFTVAGLGLARHERWRRYSLAWLVGTQGVTAAIVAAVVLHMVLA